MIAFILEALIMPLEAYFTPSTLLAYIAEQVPADNTFLQAFAGTPATRQKAIRFILQVSFAMVIFPVAATLIGWLLIPNANLPYMLTGVLISLGIGLGLGVLPRLFSYFERGIAGGIAFGVIFGSVLCILFGVYSSIAGSTDSSSIASAVDSPAGLLANAVLLGIVLGIIIRIFISTVASDMRQTMLVGIIILVPLVIGLALFSQPQVLMTNRVAGICIFLSFTGWFVLPFQILLSIINRILISMNPQLAPRLWTISPVRWDDFYVFPSPDVVPILLQLHSVDHELYLEAFNRVDYHAFQSRYAEIAQQRIRNSLSTK